jgi:hypothetical protein
VTIKRKGALAKMTQGMKGDKRIPMANITSVQFKPATNLTNGYLQFSLTGSSENKGGLMDATKDENSVMFRKGSTADFVTIKDHIEAYLTNRIGGGGPAAPDLADQLTKLAALRDQGILNDDEFQAQKTKLLGG